MTNIPKCFECGGKMKKGQALSNEVMVCYGVIDFPGDESPGRGQTYTEMPGRPRMVTVIKCEDCGRSFIPMTIKGGLKDQDEQGNYKIDPEIAALEQAIDTFAAGMRLRLIKKYKD